MDDGTWGSFRSVKGRLVRERRCGNTIWFSPISEPDVVAAEPSHVGDDGQDKKNDQGQELEHAKEVFQLAVDVDSEKRDDGKHGPEDQCPAV